jgi:hypothetical protein
MTLALIHAIIAAATEIRFDQTALPEARLVLNDTWSGSIRMSAEEFRLLAREGVFNPFQGDGADRGNPGRKCPRAEPSQRPDDASAAVLSPRGAPGRRGACTARESARPGSSIGLIGLRLRSPASRAAISSDAADSALASPPALHQAWTDDEPVPAWGWIPNGWVSAESCQDSSHAVTERAAMSPMKICAKWCKCRNQPGACSDNRCSLICQDRSQAGWYCFPAGMFSCILRLMMAKERARH